MVDRFISTAAAVLTYGDPCILGVGRFTSDDFSLWSSSFWKNLIPNPVFRFDLLIKTISVSF